MPPTVVLGSFLAALTLFPLSAAAVFLGLSIGLLGSLLVSFFFETKWLQGPWLPFWLQV